MKLSTKKFAVAALALALSTGSLAACGDDKKDESANGLTPAPRSMNATRCAANKAVGEITFLTGYGYSAAASIIDVVTAEERGYFDAVCLDVKLQPGFTNDNVPAVSSGRVGLTSLGSASEVAVAVSKGANLRAIATYGHGSIEELAVAGDSNIKSLADLKGTTMGVIGTLPYSVRLMLARAGVKEDSFKQVQVSYDPTILGKNGIASRPVYKSNEPFQLQKAGIDFRTFNPDVQQVPSSFGVLVANADLIKKHPDAVTDFLRADLAGYRYAADHPNEAVSYAVKRATAEAPMSADTETFRWNAERELVRSSTPATKPIGFLGDDEWSKQLQPLVDELKAIDTLPELTSLYDDRFINAAYKGVDPIWSEPDTSSNQEK